MPNTIPCTGRGGSKDIWGPKKHNILLCLNFESWMFLVAAWFCMFAVWLWIIAINCYLGWKNSCMINTAMSIPFFNALRRTVQYHSDFWHDLASFRLAPPKPPPPKNTVWSFGLFGSYLLEPQLGAAPVLQTSMSMPSQAQQLKVAPWSGHRMTLYLPYLWHLQGAIDTLFF